MFNTISNISRKTDKYGDIHFISFLGSALSRIAYMDDNKFLTNYSQIIGPIIQPKILQGINNVDSNNLGELFDDQKIFGLDKSPNDIFSNYEYEYKGKNFIDFIKLNMPQNINILNGDIAGIKSYPIPGQQTPLDSVKYISIGWSNYGEVYVVADKRMPNTIFLIFRGTYSAKTAALYSKPTSVVPLTVCKDSGGEPEKFLYGIFKPTTEMIHTIIETMRYLAVDFLGARNPNSVKIFTTGHSLGGAMCSDFAYLWMGIKKTSPYNAAPYNVLADNIICISLGAPRCMGSYVAKKFCNFVSQKKILFLRITTRGDPVTALPPKTGFQHPCSDDSKMRMEISEACNGTLTMRPRPNVNYNGELDCQNYKTRAYIPNVLSHTIYLDIIYTKAVDIPRFFKGIGIAQEVLRGPNGSTICRLVMGQAANYKAIFFDVNKARERPSNIDVVEENELKKVDPTAIAQLSVIETGTPSSGGGLFSSFKSKLPIPTSSSFQNTPKPFIKIGGEIAEDRKVTKQAFDTLIQQMVPLQGNLCPQKGQMSNPFNNQVMPDLSCPGAKFGGKRYHRKPTRKHSTRKRSTRKHKMRNTHRR
jgi:hypothetical protein